MPGTVKVNAKKIRQLCDSKCWTQEQLADQAGVSVRTVQHAVDETYRGLQRYTVQCLAEALGVEVNTLIGGGDVAEGPRRLGILPPFPALFVGRKEHMVELKRRLGILGGSPTPPPASESLMLVVHGWPGVGKSTLQAQLAYDDDTPEAFPDGVYWFSAGQQFNHVKLYSIFKALGSRLGDDLDRIDAIPDEHQRLGAAVGMARALLRDKRALVMIDDLWDASWGEWFRFPGPCATLITTRIARTADVLALSAGGPYRLPVLPEQEALTLLVALVPEVVNHHKTECRQLVGPEFLEGLPLGLRVAGGLLKRMAERVGLDHLNMVDFLARLRNEACLLRERPPPGIEDLARDTPTVAAVFARTTNMLDPTALKCFIQLGSVAAKPAWFDLRLLHKMWKKIEVEDTETQAGELIDWGLLEMVPESDPPRGGRRDRRKAGYQMHGLLADYARSLLPKV